MNLPGSDADTRLSARLDGEKYGEAKEKLFPSAARLQAVRMLLESIRDGTRLDKPAGVESSKWNSFTSDTPKAYALVSLPVWAVVQTVQ